MCVWSVVSDSLWPHGLQSARLLCPWDSPGKNTAVGCHFFLQESLGCLMGKQWNFFFNLLSPNPDFHETPRRIALGRTENPLLGGLWSRLALRGLTWWLNGKQSFCQSRKCKEHSASDRDTGWIPASRRYHVPWSNYFRVPRPLKPMRPRVCTRQTREFTAIEKSTNRN